MNLLKLSWNYLADKPFSTLLSTILVALGVSLTSILFLLNKQFQDRLYKNIDGIDLVVGAKGSPLQMILSSVYHIDAPTGNIPLKESFVVTKNPYIEKAIPLALGDSYNGFRIVGTDSQYVAHFNGKVAEGRLVKKDLEVNVGSRTAEKLDLKIGSTFYGSHGLIEEGGHVHETYAYEVVGILEETNLILDQLILTSVSTVWRMHDDHGHDHEGHDHGDAHNHDAHDHDAHDHDSHDHGDTHNDDAHAHEGHDHGDAHNEDAHNHEGHDHDHSDGHNDDAHAHGGHDHSDHGHDHDAHDHGDGHNHDTHDHGDAHNHDDHNHDHGPKPSKALPPISKEGKEVTAYLVQYKKDGQGNTSMRAVVEAAQIIEENSESLGYAKPAIQLQRLLEMTGLGMDFLSALAFIIILISAFSMFISLYSSLKERRYEMALMRVMGATPSKLFMMIIMEGVLVAAAGLILGLLISHIGVQIMAADLEETYKYNFSGFIFLKEELYLGLGALTIGFLAAVIPALQSYDADISETLSNS